MKNRLREMVGEEEPNKIDAVLNGLKALERGLLVSQCQIS